VWNSGKEVIVSTSIDVRKLLLEAGAIVASILLAFALDAWWDDSVARSEARVLLANVGEEFSSSREAMVGIIGVTELEVGVAMTLAEELKGSSQAQVFDSILVLVLNDITFNPGAGAYESLMASGLLTELDAQDLRNALAAWPAVLEDAVEEQRRLQRLGDEQLKPLIEASSSDLAGVYEMLAKWETTLGSAPMSTGRNRISSTPELVSLLERRAYLLRITAT
jgi:hypothetical protein